MTAATDEEGGIDPASLPPVPACLHCALRLTVAAHIYQHAPSAPTEDGEPGKLVNMTYVMKGFAGALVDALFRFAPPEDHRELYQQLRGAIEQAIVMEMLSGTEAARRAGHTAH
jgi:hypothetical protein